MRTRTTSPHFLHGFTKHLFMLTQYKAKSVKKKRISWPCGELGEECQAAKIEVGGVVGPGIGAGNIAHGRVLI